jgi:hypothetical protein
MPSVGSILIILGSNFLGRPGVPEGNRLGLIVVYAARNAAGDAATLTFTEVRVNLGLL